ncbi:L-Fucosyltransferase [Caenorhabditis elegans]|uniref:L-Fucosyltransferase n=1 Tax=Caenorhabditis elegans TaxID=6239 RepID=Q5FC46_CAEEL|nr:L-Fucosyltransferase [Caenorhabditis elegans]CAI46608.2 L-Fucosyltransferase [Caenorhabditis elegans]|eukprot:NP_001021393.2 Uncharacterized protein CELE_F17B5.6 [Caenorhabditis elegans]
MTRFFKKVIGWWNNLNIFVRIAIPVLIFTVIWLIPRPYNYWWIRTSLYCDGKRNDEQKYLVIPMLTTITDSGLGNQLFEVVSLLGMAEVLNRTAIFNKDDTMLNEKLSFFRETVPRVAEKVASMPIEISKSARFVAPVACCYYQYTGLLTCDQSKFLVIDGMHFQSYKYFAPIESTIRQLLKPTPEELARISMKNQEEGRHGTCVHVRRGDFVADSQHTGTDETFTIKAIEYLFTKYSGTIYMISNDPDWVGEHIVNHVAFRNDMKVLRTPNNRAIDDLYFSQVYCDSVLITAPSSTFGWWIGYLSKNQSAVYYRDIRETTDEVKYQMVEEDFFPETWTKLRISDML